MKRELAFRGATDCADSRRFKKMNPRKEQADSDPISVPPTLCPFWEICANRRNLWLTGFGCGRRPPWTAKASRLVLLTSVLMAHAASLAIQMSWRSHRLHRLTQIMEGSDDGQSSISFALCFFSEKICDNRRNLWLTGFRCGRRPRWEGRGPGKSRRVWIPAPARMTLTQNQAPNGLHCVGDAEHVSIVTC
jgi:hypothetical protein